MAEREKLNLDFGIEKTVFSESTPVDSDLIFGSDDEETPETTPAPPAKEAPKATVKPKDKEKPEQKFMSQEEIHDQIFEDDETEEEITPAPEKDKPKKEDEPKKTEEKKEDQEESTETPEDENPYKALAEDMVRLGIFNLDEGEQEIDVESGEQLKERWIYEQRRSLALGFENFLSQFGDDYKEMFDAVFINGVKPTEYLQAFNALNSVKEVDLSDSDNQEFIIRESLRRKGLDKEQIDNKVKRLKNNGDLEEEAKIEQSMMAKEEEKTLAQMKEQEERKRKDKQREEQNFTQAVKSVLSTKLKDGGFDGIPLDQKTAVETLKFLTDKPYKTAQGQLVTPFDKFLLELHRPENYELKVKVALLAQKKFDLSQVKNSALSSEKSELFSSIARYGKQQKAKPTAAPSKTPPATSPNAPFI